MLTVDYIIGVLSSSLPNTEKDRLLYGEVHESSLCLLVENNQVGLIRNLLRKNLEGNYILPETMSKEFFEFSIHRKVINKAMILAISNGYTEIVSIFLKKIAAGNYVHDDIDVSEAENYALRTAAFHGHTAIVRILLEKDEHGNYVHAGIDVAARNNYALRLASEDGHLEVVRMLLEKGPTGNYVHAGIKVNAGVSEAKDDNYSLRWASIKGLQQ